MSWKQSYREVAGTRGIGRGALNKLVSITLIKRMSWTKNVGESEHILGQVITRDENDC